MIRPKSAFLAVTLLCNSKCVMCDIWKNKGLDFLPLSVYEKLPDSLEMIDITGGEPFLRPDIPDVVSVLRKTCPKARILITTHGFMTEKIQSQVGDILKRDPGIAFRVSLDGLGALHDEIRGIPHAFDKAYETLKVLRQSGVKDLGITFTLMKKNENSLREVYLFSKREGFSFSLNAVHDSPVYFGEGKEPLNTTPEHVRPDFKFICDDYLKQFHPKAVGKAWFFGELYRYLKTHRRPFACGAGENFFYMDSAAHIYMCHFKSWKIGNLQTENFDTVWSSQAKQGYLPGARECQDCWMICTAKDAIKNNKMKVLGGLLTRNFFK